MPVNIPYPQIFNELSFVKETNNDDFLGKMESLLSVVDGMNSIGFDLGIAYTEDLLDKECLRGITFEKWLRSKSSIQKEQKIKQRFLHLFLNKGRRLNSIYNPDLKFEYFYKNNTLKNISGLAASFHFGLPSISLQNNEFRDNYEFNVTIRELNENTGDNEDYEDKAISISQSCDIDKIFDENTRKIYNEIKSGQDIIDHNKEMLLYLVFSQTAYKQLQCMSSTNFTVNGFMWVCKTLLFLNHIIYRTLTEKQDFFDITGHLNTIANTESNKTKEKFPNSRTFTFENGEKRECWAHVKHSDKRIYFCVDRSQGKIYVGHIGEHLPIASGNT